MNLNIEFFMEEQINYFLNYVINIANLVMNMAYQIAIKNAYLALRIIPLIIGLI